MQASNKWLLLADPEAGTLVSWPSLRHCFFVHVHWHMLILIPNQFYLWHSLRQQLKHKSVLEACAQVEVLSEQACQDISCLAVHQVRSVAACLCLTIYKLQTFKPPKLRKSGASSSDDGVANVLPVDSKEVHATARGGNNLAQRNTTQQNGNAMSSASASQYPSETHVQQRYTFL